MEKKTKNEKSGLKNGDFGQNGSKKAQIDTNTPRIYRQNSAHLTFEIPLAAPQFLICEADSPIATCGNEPAQLGHFIDR
jgi:hypothetical protein